MIPEIRSKIQAALDSLKAAGVSTSTALPCTDLNITQFEHVEHGN